MINHKKKIIGGFVGAAALTVLSMGIYTIDTGTVGVISTTGKYSLTEQSPGLNFKIPFVQGIRIVNTQQAVNQEIINTLDSNNLPIQLHVTLKWRVINDQASEMLARYDNGIFERSIKPTVREVVRNIIGGYNGESIGKDRSKIAIHLESELRKTFDSQDDKFFEFIGLNVRDIILDATVMNKIKAVQVAKQKEQELKNEVLQKDQEAKKRKIDADTAYYERTKKANATATAILVEAKAQAKANKLVSASLSTQLIENNKINRWDGALPKVSGSDNMSLFIPSDAVK